MIALPPAAKSEIERAAVPLLCKRFRAEIDAGRLVVKIDGSGRRAVARDHRGDGCREGNRLAIGGAGREMKPRWSSWSLPSPASWRSCCRRCRETITEIESLPAAEIRVRIGLEGRFARIEGQGRDVARVHVAPINGHRVRNVPLQVGEAAAQVHLVAGVDRRLDPNSGRGPTERRCCSSQRPWMVR